jgi:hypothetical protein
MSGRSRRYVGSVKRQRTIAVLGVVAVALVVLGLLFVMPKLTDPGPAETSVIDSRSSPGPPDSSMASSNPSHDQAKLRGSGYSYALPSDWRDVTSILPSVLEADSATIWGGTTLEDSRANLMVHTPFDDRLDDLDIFRKQLRRSIELTADKDVTLEDVGPRDIGGLEAIGVRVLRPLQGGFWLNQTQWIVKAGDTAYLLTTRRRDDDAAADGVFQEIFASWRWKA